MYMTITNAGAYFAQIGDSGQKRGPAHRAKMVALSSKPQLPPEIAELLPTEIIARIQSFVPRNRKEKPSSPNLSPEAERDLRVIQRRSFKRHSEMYLRDLEDFILC